MEAISRDELKVILMFAFHVAKVDQEIAGLERKILKRYMELIGLTQEERMELMGSDKSLSHRLETLTSPEAKQLLVKTLCAVAHSDGVMHEREGDFIRKVNGQLGNAVDIQPFEDWEMYEKEVLEQLGVN